MNTKTASTKPTQGADIVKGNGALTAKKDEASLTLVKKKMSIAEKLDSLHALEALSSKHEYLKETKQNLDSFGTGSDGFGGAKMTLVCNYKEVKVSNPAIVEELTKIAKMRLQEAIIKTEKEIQEFEIV